MKYRKRPVEVEVLTFEELVQYGIDSGANLVNGMPWSFTFNGYPITHENDYLYKISTLEGIMDMSISDYLIVGVHGEIYPCKKDIFEKTYEKV